MRHGLLLVLIFSLLTLALTASVSGELTKIGQDWDNVEKFTKDETTSKYGKYEIKNSILGIPFLQLSKVADVELKINSDKCVYDCFAEKEIVLYNDGVLVSDIVFKTLRPDGSWLEQPIISYKFSTKKVMTGEKINCYDDGFYKNGTKKSRCVLEEYNYDGWEEYKMGQVVKAGTYTLRLDGHKKSTKTVDWIIKSNGIWTGEWSIWNVDTLDDSILSYYTFDSLESGEFVDLHNVQNLTNNGTVNSSGIINSSRIHSRAGNDFTKMSSAGLPVGNAARTVSVWVYMTDINDAGNTNVLFSYGTLSDSLFFSVQLVGDSGDRPYFWGYNKDILGFTTVTEDQWHHIVVTHDGTTTRLYLDGTNEGNATQTLSTSGSTFFTGHLQYSPVHSIDGKIDELGIWDRALTTTEITELYNSGEGLQAPFRQNSLSELIYPVDDSINTSRIEANYTCSGDILESGVFIENVSLYTNRSGTWQSDYFHDFVTETQDEEITFTSSSDLNNNSVKWNCYFCDTEDDCSFSLTNYTVFWDNVGPTFNIEEPNETINYYKFEGNNNITFNETITDMAGLSNCWYDYDGTNVSIDGCVSGVRNSTNITIKFDNYNLTFYSNDTLGNLNTENYQWSYVLLEESQDFSSIVLEGSSDLITANVTLSSDFRVNGVVLNYNGTDFLGSFTEYQTNKYTLSINKEIPQVDEQSNVTFYWNLSFESGQYQNTSSNNQTITSFGIDDCSAFTFPIFNFTIVDEDSQVQLDGTTDNTEGSVELLVINEDTGEEAFNFSNNYSMVNPFGVCFELDIGDSAFYINATVEYKSDNRFTEFYNIRNYYLANDTDNQNITLYDLTTANGQEFKITYKGDDFVPLQNALVQIQRKYVNEGLLKVVEIPRTSSVGYAVAHLIPNDAIYNLIILQNGVILDSFLEVIPNCQNPSISECEINLNPVISGSSLVDIVEDTDFSSSLTYDEDTKVVSASFVIPSGVASKVDLEVDLLDNFGNNSVCSDTLTSSGGTLTCTVPEAFGNSTIYAKVEVNDQIKRHGAISQAQKPKERYDGIIIMCSIVLLMFIVGIGVSDKPELMGVFLILGSLILVALNMVFTTSFFGAGATILWFVVCVVMIIIKSGSKR
jgi:hypothetical protein